MKIKHKFVFFFLIILAVLLTVILYPYALNSAVLDPKGIIALKERDLIYISTLLMLIVVIPVFILTFAICLRYRASNKSAEYTPHWSHDTLAEAIWWGFPCLIIIVLSIVTWKSSHELDPYKPIFQTKLKPIRIQAVALQWKWLFIYPDEKVASLNFLQFPELTPLNFEITADAPMNSFWIPQLGGQIYAMPGMNTKLHLLAQEVGDFRGSSANLSGVGFAGMFFTARSSSQEEYMQWLESIRESTSVLGKDEYEQLVKPSEYNSPASYVLKDEDLFEQIVMKYMMPMPMQEAKSQVVDNT